MVNDEFRKSYSRNWLPASVCPEKRLAGNFVA